MTTQLTKSIAGMQLVGEVVQWGAANKAGVYRKVDFRWHNFNVAPGTKLYALPEEAQSAADIIQKAVCERMRQLKALGWTTEHDDEHVSEELAGLAAFYALPEAARYWDATSTGYGKRLGDAILPQGWFADSCDRRQELTKAIALLVAEVQRMDRAGVAESAK